MKPSDFDSLLDQELKRLRESFIDIKIRKRSEYERKKSECTIKRLYALIGRYINDFLKSFFRSGTSSILFDFKSKDNSSLKI